MADTGILRGQCILVHGDMVTVDAVRAISYSDGWQEMGPLRACPFGPCMYDKTTAGSWYEVAGV